MFFSFFFLLFSIIFVLFFLFLAYIFVLFSVRITLDRLVNGDFQQLNHLLFGFCCRFWFERVKLHLALVCWVVHIVRFANIFKLFFPPPFWGRQVCSLGDTFCSCDLALSLCVSDSSRCQNLRVSLSPINGFKANLRRLNFAAWNQK